MFYSVSAAAARGGRPYMEDRMVLKHFRDTNGNLSGMFFAILDGHGGPQASEYTREHLWPTISMMDGFSSDNDAEVLDALKNAFLLIHERMELVRDTMWPARPNGFASTAGTTCSCALIRDNKIYTAHVGDSRIILLTESEDNDELVAVDLTRDHKPDDPEEIARIEQDGGRVTNYTPVARVMWTREMQTNDGDSRRTESIPFLSIARSLGDYWSYVPSTDKYAVSPVPDCAVREIDSQRDKYLLLITDGITNVLSSPTIAEYFDEWRMGIVRNPARCLLKAAMIRWRNLKADNMSVISVGFHDPQIDDFTTASSLYAGAPLDLRLTSYPREILLLYPQHLRIANPEWDDLVLVKPDEDTEENYFGPGYINRTPSMEVKLRQNNYLMYSLRTPKLLTGARNSLATNSRPLERRATFHVTLKRPNTTNGLNCSLGLSRASPPAPQRAKVQRLEYAGSPLYSHLNFPAEPDSSASQPRLLRALSSAPVLVTNTTRSRATDQQVEEDSETPHLRSLLLRQSWPASARTVTTVVNCTESKLLTGRPLSQPSVAAAALFPVRRIWELSNNGRNSSSNNSTNLPPVLSDDLSSEEDTPPAESPPSPSSRFAPKRKRNLESDEIEAKRHNCRV